MKAISSNKQIKYGEWTPYFKSILFPIQFIIIFGTSIFAIASLIMLIIDGTWSASIWYLSGLVNNIVFLLITLLSKRAFRNRIKSIGNEDDYRVPSYYFQIWLWTISIFNLGFTFANIFIVADNGNLDTCQFIVMGFGFFWTVYISAIIPLFYLRNRYLSPRVKLSNSELTEFGISNKKTIAVSKALSELKTKRKVMEKLSIKSWEYKFAVQEILEKINIGLKKK